MTGPEYQNVRGLLRRFRQDEGGSMTVMGLFIFIASGILGAFALDVTTLFASRTHLQIAADQAAHAAIYNRTVTGLDQDDSRDLAIALVQKTLPTGRYGASLLREDIQFGTYVAGAGFTENENSLDAVRVVTSFTDTKKNPAAAYLFRLIGFDQFDIVTESIYQAYGPTCLNEGYVANGIVDIQSNNNFVDGFCVHSNTHVSVNNRNTYEPGTIVSMPNLDDFDIPGGLDSENTEKLNEGITQALKEGEIDIRVFTRIDNLIERYKNPDATYEDFPSPTVLGDTDGWPDYIGADTAVLSSEYSTVTTADLVTGRVHNVTCPNKNQGLTINATADVMRNLILVTDCDIKFANGSAFENVRIITTSNSDKSMSSSNGLVLGKKDSCDDGVQFMSNGGMDFAANLEVHGTQLISRKDIKFAAGPEGLNGASFIANGEIDGTSGGNMGLCGGGMGSSITATYFRMVN